MKSTMRHSTFYSLLFLAASLFVSACNRTGDIPTAKAGLSPEAIAASIPDLLERHASIRNGKEWDDVQNYYGAQRQALISDQAAIEPRLKLAELFIQEARVTGEHPHYYPAALQMIDDALVRIPQENPATLNIAQKDLLFRALSAKAGVQLSLHDFASALQTAQQAVALNPYNAQIYGALVDAHVELGQYAKAVEMADKMVGIRPDLRSYSRVSYLREIHGQVDGAIEALNMAIAAGLPGQEASAWARLTLGNLYQTYGDWKNAGLQYRMILAERPDYPFALAALAEVEMHQKQYAAAEDLLKKACAIIPEVGYFEQLAELYRETGRQAEYEALLPEIRTMMQEDMDKGHNMSLELAAFYADLQPDYDKALQYALGEYQKRPDNIDVNRLLARIYALKKDPAKAGEHLAKAALTGSRHPDLTKIQKMLPG